MFDSPYFLPRYKGEEVNYNKGLMFYTLTTVVTAVDFAPLPTVFVSPSLSPSELLVCLCKNHLHPSFRLCDGYILLCLFAEQIFLLHW